MPEYPEVITPELRDVLGTLCFRLSPIAENFRSCGENIPRQAEAEQAFVLHWLIGLALKHGPDWRAVAARHIERMARVKVPSP